MRTVGHMNASTKLQKGSPNRDKFKYMHKSMLPNTAWALDLDLVLVEKHPIPFIVAVLDFKMNTDGVGFTEALCYQWFLSLPSPYTVPVYIIEAAPNFKDESTPPDDHRFAIRKIAGADYRPNPPTTKYEIVATDITWAGVSEWQMELRKRRKAEILSVLGPQPVPIGEYIRQGAGYAKSHS